MFISLGLLMHVGSFAQNETEGNSGAAQSAVLTLNDGIDISYVATGDAAGHNAVMQFKTPNDYSNGVMSPD